MALGALVPGGTSSAGPSPARPFSVGEAADARLAGALARVGQELPYLSALPGPPPSVLAPGTPPADREWWNCDELLADPGWLATVVKEAGRRLGARTGAVAASLFVQGYAYRVLTLAVCCLLMGGVLPASGPAELAMALSNGRPAFVAYRAPKALTVSEPVLEGAGALLATLVEDAVEGHMRLLVAATLSRFRVGRRLLWGDVAASAAVAFRTTEGLLGPAVKPLGERFFSLVPAEMKGQGKFFTLEHAGRSVWYWERRNCCLHYRLPSGARCADCSLTPAGERLAYYRAALEAGAGQPNASRGPGQGAGGELR
jgi:ferric iron reductase protein FhuF